MAQFCLKIEHITYCNVERIRYVLHYSRGSIDHVTRKLFYFRPSPSWKCPLCNHTCLVAQLEVVLQQFDANMDLVEQRRHRTFEMEVGQQKERS